MNEEEEERHYFIKPRRRFLRVKEGGPKWNYAKEHKNCDLMCVTHYLFSFRCVRFCWRQRNNPSETFSSILAENPCKG